MLLCTQNYAFPKNGWINSTWVAWGKAQIWIDINLCCKMTSMNVCFLNSGNSDEISNAKKYRHHNIMQSIKKWPTVGVWSHNFTKWVLTNMLFGGDKKKKTVLFSETKVKIWTNVGCILTTTRNLCPICDRPSLSPRLPGRRVWAQEFVNASRLYRMINS